LTVRLGLAGGPLVVALILGNLGHTGKVVWTLPYNANLTLRQLGLILFLAGIGTHAGYDFVAYLHTGGGVEALAIGAAVTAAAAVLTLTIGGVLLRIPFGTLIGVLAGLQTQPAVLAFSLEQSEDETPNIGYATVYPVATIAKVVFGQVLMTVMG
jgi:putative transport protein